MAVWRKLCNFGESIRHQLMGSYGSHHPQRIKPWGDGVKADREKAFGYYLTSAKKGNPETQYKIGTCYETGQGTTQDSQQAMLWYRKSAEQGYPEAEERLKKND